MNDVFTMPRCEVVLDLFDGLGHLLIQFIIPINRVVDIYALISHLLSFEPSKETDSEFARISHLLKTPNNTEINTALEKVEDFISYLLDPKNLPITGTC